MLHSHWVQAGTRPATPNTHCPFPSACCCPRPARSCPARLNSASGIVFANKAVFSNFGFKFTCALTWIHTVWVYVCVPRPCCTLSCDRHLLLTNSTSALCSGLQQLYQSHKLLSCPELPCRAMSSCAVAFPDSVFRVNACRCSPWLACVCSSWQGSFSTRSCPNARWPRWQLPTSATLCCAT